MTSLLHGSSFPTARLPSPHPHTPHPLAADLPAIQTRGTYRRENEKKRSKCNRDKFKQYMCELNECMGFKKLSINKCLSTAVSLMKLSLFTETFTEQLQQVHSSLVYEVGSYLGLVFDEDGRILHVTEKVSEHPLPFNMANIGSFLTQICFNSPQILEKVFKQNSTHMEMKLKYSKKNKQPTSVFFKGKVLLNKMSNMKIFIGYACIADKKDIVRDPFMFNTGLEVWINSNYDVIKSHSWLDLLLEDSLRHLKDKPLSLLSLLHPDDLGVIKESEQQIQSSGYFKVSCRVFTGENYLWLTARGYPQDTHAEIYVWPFASESIEGGDMTLLDGKKLWNSRQKRFNKSKSRHVTLENGDTDDTVADAFAAGVKRSHSESSCGVKRSHSESSSESEKLSPKKVALSSDVYVDIEVDVKVAVCKDEYDRNVAVTSALCSTMTSPDCLSQDKSVLSLDSTSQDSISPAPSTQIYSPRLSAFEVRSSYNKSSPTFVPVTGNIPVLCVKPIPCKVARVEPLLKRTEYICTDWVKNSSIVSPEQNNIIVGTDWIKENITVSPEQNNTIVGADWIKENITVLPEQNNTKVCTDWIKEIRTVSPEQNKNICADHLFKRADWIKENSTDSPEQMKTGVCTDWIKENRNISPPEQIKTGGCTDWIKENRNISPLEQIKTGGCTDWIKENRNISPLEQIKTGGCTDWLKGRVAPQQPRTVSVSQIERLVKMSTVLNRLKSTNPALYTEFAGVLDIESEADDKVLKMLPLIIKLQQHDTPAYCELLASLPARFTNTLSTLL